MLSNEVVEFFMESVPDEIRILRDDLAKGETDNPIPIWERHRDTHEHVTQLKQSCEEKGHPLVIALTGKPGTRRRLMANSRNERRACIMCGTEEVGTPATGLLWRLLFRTTTWKFEGLRGHISRAFADPEWYFETLWVIRNFSFSTDVVLQHAFPPLLPLSFLSNGGKSSARHRAEASAQHLRTPV